MHLCLGHLALYQPDTTGQCYTSYLIVETEGWPSYGSVIEENVQMKYRCVQGFLCDTSFHVSVYYPFRLSVFATLFIHSNALNGATDAFAFINAIVVLNVGTDNPSKTSVPLLFPQSSLSSITFGLNSQMFVNTVGTKTAFIMCVYLYYYHLYWRRCRKSCSLGRMTFLLPVLEELRMALQIM